MASGHATASPPSFYCYKCDQHIVPIANSRCPNCNDGFIEEVPAVQHVPGRPRHMGRTFLNQFENSGPPPATENRINTIPTVKITAEQARDNLQCAICMDEFKQGEEAKRLNCTHHFHEPCISRWLRLHGTCPTCRVTLDGQNTSNHEYFQQQPQYSPTNNSSNQNNRRGNGGGAAGGGNSSSNGPSFPGSQGGYNHNIMEFD
ncbi:unnamed protein product [Didymodactylos carnosus]|uniref:RING-type E3 ubiquitin transferase n=1 Tax=Didymodactylos carnosus TaxID=1234261 RepID=A0A814HH38_9BILA|nr:unnamed protein product [Didymodactylos carnosus]CAF3782159.1 unnamed protein product [Didymodactylos carnosus]